MSYETVSFLAILIKIYAMYVVILLSYKLVFNQISNTNTTDKS